jgi:hypothetical protein
MVPSAPAVHRTVAEEALAVVRPPAAPATQAAVPSAVEAVVEGPAPVAVVEGPAPVAVERTTKLQLIFAHQGRP